MSNNGVLQYYLLSHSLDTLMWIKRNDEKMKNFPIFCHFKSHEASRKLIWSSYNAKMFDQIPVPTKTGKRSKF